MKSKVINMKKLSIVIPTLNRAKLLIDTINAFKGQINRNSAFVELIVCNNASEDNTIEQLNSINSIPFFSIIDYKDRVDIGNSIYRSLLNATGEYVILWGDDDMPCPYFLDIVLSYLSKYPNIGLLHYNRLRGIDEDGTFKSLSVLRNEYHQLEEKFEDTDIFLQRFFTDTTFISSIIFRKEDWEKYQSMETSNHYGYEFYAPIFCGAKDKDILYINYPLCIQRIANFKKRFWSSNAALCRLLGIPNLLKCLGDNGVVKKPNKIWNAEPNTFFPYTVALLQAAGYKKKYKPLLKEICAHQPNWGRKLWAYFIIYCIASKTYMYLKQAYSN